MRNDNCADDDAETLDGAELTDPDDAANDDPTDDGRMQKPKHKRRDDVPHPRRRSRTTLPVLRGSQP